MVLSGGSGATGGPDTRSAACAGGQRRFRSAVRAVSGHDPVYALVPLRRRKGLFEKFYPVMDRHGRRRRYMCQGADVGRCDGLWRPQGYGPSHAMLRMPLQRDPAHY